MENKETMNIWKEGPEIEKTCEPKYRKIDVSWHWIEIIACIARWILRHAIAAMLIVALSSAGLYNGALIEKVALTVVSWWVSREIFSMIGHETTGTTADFDPRGSTIGTFLDIRKEIRWLKSDLED